MDEIHLFLKEALRIVNNQLVVPTESIKRFSKVIALSATFGGQQGVAEVLDLFSESIFIQSPQELKEKNLWDVEVHGNFNSRDILLQKAIEVAKERASHNPVIFFCEGD